MFKTILGSAQVNSGGNNFRFSSGKFGGKHRNQQTITCQVLTELNKIWSCLIFIKLYLFRIIGSLQPLCLQAIHVVGHVGMNFGVVGGLSNNIHTSTV